MKAAIYARVSTEEQVQNFSIDNQLGGKGEIEEFS